MFIRRLISGSLLPETWIREPRCVNDSTTATWFPPTVVYCNWFAPLAMVNPSVRLSVCLSICPSVIRWHCVKMTHDTTMRSSLENNPHDSNFLKILERLALSRLRPHLLQSPNFSRFQSAYRHGHSTETALIHVMNQVYSAADSKSASILVGLDLTQVNGGI